MQATKAQTDLLHARVSAEDRAKLDIHLSSIEAVERTIGQANLGESCGPPDTDVSDTSIPGIARAQVDLLTMALACDMTRVASLTLGDHQDWSWRGIDFPGGWHDAVHAGPATPEREDALIRSFSWYAEQLGYLLARLDATPEGDGSLLDHTLVVVGNIFSTGAAHSHEGKTYLLAGGGAGLVGGQNLDFGGATNGDLFTTILQALGFEDTFFGERDFCTGPLAGVFA